MKIKFYAVMVVTILSIAAGKVYGNERAFIDLCVDSIEEYITEDICTCLYHSIQNDFSEEQLTRIAGLLQITVADAEDSLQSAGSDSDIDIYNRLDLIKNSARQCYEQSRED